MSFSGPQISAFSASRSFHVRSLFLFGFFWFKEQEKQTESNPLSSQSRFDPYQLGVITMPLSSGVKGLRLDIKYNLTASRQGSGLTFLWLHIQKLYLLTYFCPVRSCRCQNSCNWCASASPFKRQPVQFVLNGGEDNYPALVCSAPGHRPAETRDAPERFRSY